MITYLVEIQEGRRVLFEKYQVKTLIRNELIELLDNCEVDDFRDGRCRIYVKNGDALFEEDNDRDRFYIEENIWSYVQTRLGLNLQETRRFMREVFSEFYTANPYCYCTKNNCHEY